MSKRSEPRIHRGWLRTSGKAPTRTCEWCKRPFDPGDSNRLFCGKPDCETAREMKRREEVARLKQMLQEADEKRRRQGR